MGGPFSSPQLLKKEGVGQASRQLGVSTTTLYKWRDSCEEQGEQGLTRKQGQHKDPKFERLKRENRYGADTLRLYGMFLGPLEQAKPWNTNGIDGTYRFIRKFWRLFYNDNGDWIVTDETPAKDELKVLHKTIKKVQEDIESFSFNTAVSAFMSVSMNWAA